MDKLISLADLPVIIIIGLGIWIPAFLPVRKLSVYARFAIDEAEVVVVSAIAGYVAHLLSQADMGVVFTRAFLIIGIAHVVLIMMYVADKQKAALVPVTPPLDVSK